LWRYWILSGGVFYFELPCRKEYKTKKLRVCLWFVIFKSVFMHVCMLQTVVATLHRDSAGLGFSVAGGKGTMPYRVDDEVSATCNFLSALCEKGHSSSHRQHWGLGLAQCATPLTLGLVLYILTVQLSLRVSLKRCQWCGPVLQVEPLAPAVCYPRRRLSPHPDAPNLGVMACHSLRRGHRRTLCTCPWI